VPNPPHLRRPGWIGTSHWRPKLRGFECDYYDVAGLRREDVVQAQRHVGIALNFRTDRPAIYHAKHQKLLHSFHVAINSGIKLINCFSFGTPSISADEPAYHELGVGCTIISDVKKCARWVRELQNDDELYMNLRRHCLRRAAKYHLDAIAEKYRKLLRSL